MKKGGGGPRIIIVRWEIGFGGGFGDLISETKLKYISIRHFQYLFAKAA